MEIFQGRQFCFFPRGLETHVTPLDLDSITVEPQMDACHSCFSQKCFIFVSTKLKFKLILSVTLCLCVCLLHQILPTQYLKIHTWGILSYVLLLSKLEVLDLIPGHATYIYISPTFLPSLGNLVFSRLPSRSYQVG